MFRRNGWKGVVRCNRSDLINWELDNVVMRKGDRERVIDKNVVK